MKLMNVAALALPMFLTGACIDGGTDTPKPDDTSTETGLLDTDVLDTDVTDTDLEALAPVWDDGRFANGWSDAVTCSATDDSIGATFEMDLYTVNWGYGARAFLADTRFDGAWSEEHELTETDLSADPSGYSEYSLDLTVVATIGEVGEGTSIFGCDDLTAGNPMQSVTYVVEVLDIDGSVADCIAFGHDPAGLLANTVPDLTVPQWVLDAGCRVGGQ